MEMQWGQIKTLFILCFLILNIFLLRQFITGQEEEYAAAPDVEVNLQDNLSGLEDVPESPKEASMLYAKRKEITEEDIKELEGLENQEIVVIDHHLILSQLDKPVPFDIEETEENIRTHIWNDESYNFEDYSLDTDTNTYIFFQKIEEPIFYNQSGALLVRVNDKGEMTHYVQTMLEKAEEQEEETYGVQEPLTIITNLFEKGNIISGATISDVTFGYQNLLPLPDGVQVLTPTWEIEVNDANYFYANAIEGHILTRDEKSFVVEMNKTIQNYTLTQKNTLRPLNEELDEDDAAMLINTWLQNMETTNGVKTDDTTL
jgi:regulatory protein YycI of two-component signal transduction system YycFG